MEVEVKQKKFVPAKLHNVAADEPLGDGYEIVKSFYKACGNRQHEVAATLDILRICVASGVKFGKKDYVQLMNPNSYHSPRWVRDGCAEQLYTTACMAKNISAAVMMEVAMKRIPWKVKGIRVALDFNLHHASDRDRIHRVTRIDDGKIRLKSYILGEYDHRSHKWVGYDVKLHCFTEEQWHEFTQGVFRINEWDVK